MNFNPLILYIVFAVIAGYLFGILDSRFTSSLRKNKKTEVKEPLSEPAANDSNRVGERTVLKVSVDKGQKWHIDLDGERLLDAGAISSEQRKKIISTLGQIRPWLEGKPGQKTPAERAPIPAIPTSVAPIPVPSARPIIEPVNSSPVSPQPDNENPLKLDPVRGFGSMLIKDVKAKTEKPPSSIVTMIDAVLQTKLVGTPLANKGIRLEDGPMGSVLVCVGSHRYEGVGAVPEPEIREIIKEAIVEWERK